MNANDLRKGSIVKHKGALWQAVDCQRHGARKAIRAGNRADQRGTRARITYFSTRGEERRHALDDGEQDYPPEREAG